MSVIDPSTGEPWVPAFDGQRPPFQPGNTLSVGNKGPLSHGAYSPRHTDPIALAYYDAVMADDDLTLLRNTRFANAVWSYCSALAKVDLLEEWVAGMTIEAAARSDKGQTSALELLRKWSSTVDTKAARLGLDPVSWARIHKDVAATRVDLARLLSDRPEANPDGGE